MFDAKTTYIVNIILSYLKSIDFDTQMISCANIEKYPKRISSGINFSPVPKDNPDGIRYAILIYPTFDKTIFVTRTTLESLLKQGTPRATTFNSVLHRDDDYLFLFVFMHEIGHIQHIIELNVDDDIFFNPLTGINSNPSNNFYYENYADQYSLKHIDEIYGMLRNENTL